uniref:Transposase n=1 Tax=Heterorhabditis bacteriophora TaxID=37862 RepID=A0A1I7X5S3_HETBA
MLRQRYSKDNLLCNTIIVHIFKGLFAVTIHAKLQLPHPTPSLRAPEGIKVLDHFKQKWVEYKNIYAKTYSQRSIMKRNLLKLDI